MIWKTFKWDYLKKSPDTSGGDPHSAQAAAIRQQVKDAFFVDTPQWRDTALERAMQIWQQALEGMQDVRGVDTGL